VKTASPYLLLKYDQSYKCFERFACTVDKEVTLPMAISVPGISSENQNMVSFMIEYAHADDSGRERTMAQRKYLVMSVEDYLVLNRNSKDMRYEYLDGDVRMLAGGSPDHSIIIANLTAAIKGPLKGNPCRVYNSDVQLKLSEKRYVFPDITISCDERDRNQKETIHYPLVVVEVLSPTTEATDRGKKAAYYRASPTIQEYVMVDSEEVFVEVHRREETRSH
jgi:Uma2 family endonuclease